MNKSSYRLISNKLRGVLITTLRSFSSSLLCALGLVSFLAPAHAQIVVDHAAPKQQQPTVLNAGNGVPLINIQTPSAAGVSRNTYTQFDVQQQGVILNNARTNAQTQLGGWVQGNPWLANGTARVILNEVNSNNPTFLRGYIEVGGDRAQVVVANPAGITCNGCGYINASRATLTTGVPVMNGASLESYVVNRGSILIEGAGLDASQVDYTDVIARAVQVNAGIWAKDLTVTAGANRVSADHTQVIPLSATGAVPAFAIDVAQLGGMYAGKIRLIGTESGVGVRNLGQIGASAGEVVITADGRLQNSGRISSATHTQITTNGGIGNSGMVYAQSNATLATSGLIDNTGGTLAANQTLDLNAAGLNNNQGKLLSLGDIRVQLTGDYTHIGELQANGAVSLQTSGRITNQSTLLAGTYLTIQSAVLDNALTGEISANTVSLHATGISNRGLIDGSETLIDAVALNNLGNGRIYGDHVAIGAVTLTNAAENGVAPVIAARNRLDVGALTIDNREHALLFSAGDLAIGAILDTNRRASGQADTLNNHSATIEATAGLDIAAKQIHNTDAHFSTHVVEVARA